MKKIPLTVCLLVSVLGTGCMFYTLKPATPLEFDKIYVAPIRNDSFVPQAQETLTKRVREKLTNISGLKLAPSPENAAILEITIIEFGRFLATSQEDDTSQAKSFNIRLAIHCTLSNSVTGRVYFKDYRISDFIECPTYNDNFQTLQSQAIPRLANKVADKVCDIICHLW